jgi:TonB-linked SusC/RagA family outer membrane protein
MLNVCCLLVGTAAHAQRDSLPEQKISMGYYATPAAAITGAVETVSGATLEKTPAADLSLSLAGRLNGLTTIETTGELTNSSVSKFIRGVSTINGTYPLIIIDGVICPTTNWDYLTAYEIESISILKDGSSTAIYGMQSAAGAIIITTKRGFNGKAKIEGYFDQSFQQNVYHPQFITSAQYVKMRNQAAINDGLPLQFSQSVVAGFEQGNNPLYPNNDWYSMSVNDWVQMQRAGLNISGGNENVRYFTNLSYMHQSSPLKVTPNDKFDPTPWVNSINFRSNVDLKINSYLSGFLRLSGNVNLQKTPASNTNAYAYSSVFATPPTMYGPLTGEGSLFNAAGTQLEGSNQVVTTSSVDDPVYGNLNRAGYLKRLETTIVAQSGLTFDMSFLTEGLSLSALMAYQTYAYSSTATVQTYKTYVRDLSRGYDEFRFIQKLDDRTSDDVLIYGKYSQFMYNLNLSAQADYNRTFGDHSISAMTYITSMTQSKEIPLIRAVLGFTSLGADILPYKRLDMGATATYGYKNRYFLKGDLGYTGSDQFARSYRYVATPAVSVAWIASEEDFLKGNDILTYLKLRVSYGINANDQLGDFRFMYLDEYSADGTETALGNPFVTAEKIEKQNYGVDFGLIKDFTLHFDYYRAHTDNMLIDGAIPMPAYAGIPGYPKLNEGEMENHGFEASVMYQKQLRKDFAVFAGAGLAYNKNKVISINDVPLGEGYKYQHTIEGFPVLQAWGYLIDYSNGNGYINTPEELEKATAMYDLGDAPRMGDFVYQDISGDGKIDVKDFAPIGYNRIPEIYYSVNLGFEYRRFEFSALLQGTAHSSRYFSGLGVNEAFNTDGYFTDMHLNAWTPDNHNADFPALSTNMSVSHLSNDFTIMNTAYLKLRNLEVAYTLPEKISRRIAAEKIRIAFNAQNLFTFDHLRTKYIDPETANMAVFQPYRVWNIGVKVTF